MARDWSRAEKRSWLSDCAVAVARPAQDPPLYTGDPAALAASAPSWVRSCQSCAGTSRTRQAS
eukprot:10771690-Alexandrium_andersonii.AAC.1